MLDLDRSTWKRVRFDDLAHNVKDRVADPSSSGYDRYVGLEHLDAGSLSVLRWGDPSSVTATKLVFEPGDVIFGRRRAYQRKVSQAHFSGIASAHALVLRAKKDVVSERFLPVFLSSDSFLDRAISISVGSLSPTVNWRDLARQEFDLPPLDEQERIADLLWAAEEHRRRTAVAEAATGGPGEVRTSVWSALLQKHLDDVAARWGRRPLSEVGHLTRGRRFTKTDYVDEGIGCVHYGQIYTHFGAVVTRPLTYLPEELAPRLRYAEPGDLLIAGTSEDVADVCKSVAWMGEGRVAVHDDCFILRHHLDPRYASYFFASPDFHSQKLSFVSASKVVRVSAANLSRIQVPVPPMEVQEAIVNQLEQVLDASQVLAEEVSRVRELSVSLLAQVFGGP